jgi:predicted transcriptional regulator
VTPIVRQAGDDPLAAKADTWAVFHGYSEGMADTTIKIDEEIRDRLRAVAEERGMTSRQLAEQTLGELLTDAEREERMQQAREELQAAGIAVTEDTLRKAREGELFTRLQALRAAS